MSRHSDNCDHVAEAAAFASSLSGLQVTAPLPPFANSLFPPTSSPRMSASHLPFLQGIF